MGIGIAAYFALRFEPVALHYGGVAAVGAAAACCALLRPGGAGDLGWALAFAAIGFCLAGWRAHDVATPVLDFRYYGPIEGRIVGIDRSASDAPRLVLDDVSLQRVAPHKHPERVRVSLHGGNIPLVAGQRVMMTGHLSPPQGPVEPGGFDFRRHAWFLKLGAVGYTRTPVLAVAPAPEGFAELAVFRARMAISSYVREVLPGDIGGFAAAVTTGDRSGISQDALEHLRASNTAHLLAISGLHMGLLAGFVFGVLRGGLACFPSVALRWPIKKIAAIGAICASAIYLALSGGNVATERAFIMATIILVAVFFDRRALSLRGVAVAALIVLALRPEALLSPGFQMSFAATTALIAVFGAVRDGEWPVPKWVRPALGVMLSSLVAGLATAPIGAAHFNALAHYGLLANLLSVPVMGVVVVPAAVLAALLAPLGLDWVGLQIMGVGLGWILNVADYAAALPGSRSFVASPGPVVLPLIALGALTVFLWQGRARYAGVLPICLAFFLWAKAERPDVLIADNGSLVGVMGPEGRALSKAKGSGFVARTWLENDGERLPQARAAQRWPGEGRLRVIDVPGLKIVHVTGKRARDALQDCAAGTLIVSSVPLNISGPCDVWDPERLKRSGSVAISGGQHYTARAQTGARIWNTQKRPVSTSGSGRQASLGP
jgi:competence protein ComEC